MFQSLASLEEKINPGQLESDKDQLLLINEKEKLLRELRSLLSCTKGTKLKELKSKCSRLEQDLNEAQEMTNRCIAGKGPITYFFDGRSLSRHKQSFFI